MTFLNQQCLPPLLDCRTGHWFSKAALAALQGAGTRCETKKSTSVLASEENRKKRKIPTATKLDHHCSVSVKAMTLLAEYDQWNVSSAFNSCSLLRPKVTPMKRKICTFKGCFKLLLLRRG